MSYFIQDSFCFSFCTALGITTIFVCLLCVSQNQPLLSIADTVTVLFVSLVQLAVTFSANLMYCQLLIGLKLSPLHRCSSIKSCRTARNSFLQHREKYLVETLKGKSAFWIKQPIFRSRGNHPLLIKYIKLRNMERYQLFWTANTASQHHGTEYGK